jgi:hypothetical protein
MIAMMSFMESAPPEASHGIQTAAAAQAVGRLPDGKGPPGKKFGDFLDKKGAEDRPHHPSDGAGGDDSPVHRAEFPAGGGAGKADGDDEGEGGAHGHVKGNPAKQNQGRNDDGAAPDAETARGETRQKANGGEEEGLSSHGRRLFPPARALASRIRDTFAGLPKADGCSYLTFLCLNVIFPFYPS